MVADCSKGRWAGCGGVGFATVMEERSGMLGC
jgi:hypothetical protein